MSIGGLGHWVSVLTTLASLRDVVSHAIFFCNINNRNYVSGASDFDFTNSIAVAGNNAGHQAPTARDVNGQPVNSANQRRFEVTSDDPDEDDGRYVGCIHSWVPAGSNEYRFSRFDCAGPGGTGTGEWQEVDEVIFTQTDDFDEDRIDIAVGDDTGTKHWVAFFNGDFIKVHGQDRSRVYVSKRGLTTGTWSTPIQVDGGGGTSYFVKGIVAGEPGSGKVHCFYDDGTNDYWRTYDVADDSLGTERGGTASVLPAGTTHPCSNGRIITFDNGGTWTIRIPAWSSGSQLDILRFTENGSNEIIEGTHETAVSDGNTGPGAALAYNPTDDLMYYVYRDQTSGKVYMAERSGDSGAWAAERYFDEEGLSLGSGYEIRAAAYTTPQYLASVYGTKLEKQVTYITIDPGVLDTTYWISPFISPFGFSSPPPRPQNILLRR